MIYESNNYITCINGGAGWRFGSEHAIYVERLIDGRLICASYRDNGIPIYERDEDTQTPAFDLVIDGQSMYYGWEFVDFNSCMGENGITTGTLILRHTLKPVQLTVKTYCSGFGFFRRELEITNTSEFETLGLTSVTPLCGSLWQMSDIIRENLRDNSIVPYSVGSFKDFYWANEGNFDWQDIPLNTKTSVELIIRDSVIN